MAPWNLTWPPGRCPICMNTGFAEREIVGVHGQARPFRTSAVNDERPLLPVGGEEAVAQVVKLTAYSSTLVGKKLSEFVSNNMIDISSSA